MRTRLVVWAVLVVVGVALFYLSLTAVFPSHVQHPQNPKLNEMTHPWHPMGPVPLAPPPF